MKNKLAVALLGAAMIPGYVGAQQYTPAPNTPIGQRLVPYWPSHNHNHLSSRATANSESTATAGALGVGVGVGHGGNAAAQGGNAHAAGGVGYGGSATGGNGYGGAGGQGGSVGNVSPQQTINSSPQADGGEANNSFNYTEEAQKRNPVSSAIAAPLIASHGTCMGSTSGSLQLNAVGLSSASTWTDENCNARMDADILSGCAEMAKGPRTICYVRMCAIEANVVAIEATGFTCPVPAEAQAKKEDDYNDWY